MLNDFFANDSVELSSQREVHLLRLLLGKPERELDILPNLVLQAWGDGAETRVSHFRPLSRLVR